MTDVDTNNEKQIKQFEEQHLKNYQNAVIEIINNNTKSLFDEDISSLIKEPPLDSMDTIKSKLLELAKKEKIVLNTENMKEIIFKYRKSLLLDIDDIKNFRNEFLVDKVLSFEPVKEIDTIKFLNKDLEVMNKTIRQKTKKAIKNYTDSELLENLDTIYNSDVLQENKEKIKKIFSKYMKSNYQKQLLESIAIKIMVKDRTLINGTNEQGERYLFTKSNSHIFDDEKKSTKK